MRPRYAAPDLPDHLDNRLESVLARQAMDIEIGQVYRWYVWRMIWFRGADEWTGAPRAQIVEA